MSNIMKGHTFCEVSKKKAQKLFADTEVLERVMTVLNNEGKVFALREKKEIVCYYIFDRIETNRDEIIDAYYEQDEYLAERKEKNVKTYAYKLIEEYWKPEKEHLRDAFENAICANFKEYIDWGMASELIWKDETFVLEKEKKNGFNPVGIAVGMMFGISFGTSLDNMTLGIPMGLMWAFVFSMLFNAEDRKLVKKGEKDAITQ